MGLKDLSGFLPKTKHSELAIELAKSRKVPGGAMREILSVLDLTTAFSVVCLLDQVAFLLNPSDLLCQCTLRWYLLMSSMWAHGHALELTDDQSTVVNQAKLDEEPAPTIALFTGGERGDDAPAGFVGRG